MGVYGEQERRFVFKSVVVGRTSKARFKISNPNKVIRLYRSIHILVYQSILDRKFLDHSPMQLPSPFPFPLSPLSIHPLPLSHSPPLSPLPPPPPPPPPPPQIPCDVQVGVKLPSSKSKVSSEAFHVEPSSKVGIPAHAHIYATVTFRPTAMQVSSHGYLCQFS